MAEERRFPSPFEVPTPEGCEGWERMYPYHYLFSEERREYEENQFWFWDAKDGTEPCKPWEAYFHPLWQMSLSENSSRVFCIPTTNGITHRILNGYLYISGNAVEDPKVIEERIPIFTKRTGYYYEHWDELFANWVEKFEKLVEETKALQFKELPHVEDEARIFAGRGVYSGYDILENWDKLKRSWWKAWEYHFEFLNLTYVAYVTFYEFCQKAFPSLRPGVVTMMLAGSHGLSMMRPQEELAKLAKLAIELNLNELFKAKLSADELIAKLSKTRAGERWLEVLETAKDPWFYTSTGSGFETHNRCWLDDLNVPFGYIGTYVEKLEKGEEVERDIVAVGRAREALVDEYFALLRTDEDRATFTQLHNLLMKVYPYAETHIFYVEHWFHSVHRNKVREVAQLLVDAKFLDEIDDIFYFYPHEIEEMLTEYCIVWALGDPENIPARAAKGCLKPELEWRKGLIEKFKQHPPLPALGPAPDAVTEPLVIHLWGITSETVQTWLDSLHGGGTQEISNELKGFAASPGLAEGPARVIKDASQLSEVEKDEILVAPITSPSWSPVFHKLKGIITDLGGISSHAAIVAREYGLPCVCGTGYGTKAIKTGDIVRVDGTTGDVSIVKKG